MNSSSQPHNTLFEYKTSIFNSLLITYYLHNFVTLSHRLLTDFMKFSNSLTKTTPNLPISAHFHYLLIQPKKIIITLSNPPPMPIPNLSLDLQLNSIEKTPTLYHSLSLPHNLGKLHNCERWCPLKVVVASPTAVSCCPDMPVYVPTCVSVPIPISLESKLLHLFKFSNLLLTFIPLIHRS